MPRAGFRWLLATALMCQLDLARMLMRARALVSQGDSIATLPTLRSIVPTPPADHPITRSPDHPITRSPKRCAGKPADSNSCDEYPYASSQEGGAGSVTRCVASTENSRQAGTLSSFYTNNGVIDRDAYNVSFPLSPFAKVANSLKRNGLLNKGLSCPAPHASSLILVPVSKRIYSPRSTSLSTAFASTPGLQYCSASCTNTGNQVTKRNLAIATQHIARHFFTDQGHQLTSNVRTSGQIETHAWLAHEERNVTIASDLASAP
ncbi:hypothetical protein NDA17_002177 [Ustilago hordei]|nr:hypothetical protein NDA17_002177 [Ustilago hordei]